MEDHHNDFNLVVLCGKLSTQPEHRAFDSGAQLIRYLIVTRSSEPLRRTDVIPVTLWDPPAELWAHDAQRGDSIFAVGTVQRRYWEAPEGRFSTLEIMATTIELGGSAPSTA